MMAHCQTLPKFTAPVWDISRDQLPMALFTIVTGAPAQVKMCLVINKVDRLILELGLTPGEAYTRMRGIITHVNMILSAFQSEQHISDADAVLAHEDAKAGGADGAGR